MEPARHLPVYLAVASIEPPKERKRLLGPGDNLPGAFHFVELDGPIRSSGIRCRFEGLSAPPPLLAEPHLLGQVRTGRRIVRRHHRIVGRQSPFLAVLLRRHVVLRAQMTLE